MTITRIEELRKQIDNLRKELSKLYAEDIGSEEILQLSRVMDKLIVEYIQLTKKE